MLSLLDLERHSVADWFVVFRDLPDIAERSWPWRLLKSGFRHVEVWRCDRGIWLRVDPCMELIEVEAHEAPPWELISKALNPTCVHVVRSVKHQKVREPFFFGPWTCVELTKAFIGIRAPFVRTPHQLYKRLKKEMVMRA